LITVKLQDVLNRKGMAQRELSRLTGIQQPTINKICNGNITHISTVHLAVICEALDCEITDILELKKEPSV